MGYRGVRRKLTEGLGGLPVAAPNAGALAQARRRVGAAPLAWLFDLATPPTAWYASTRKTANRDRLPGDQIHHPGRTRPACPHARGLTQEIYAPLITYQLLRTATAGFVTSPARAGAVPACPPHRDAPGDAQLLW